MYPQSLLVLWRQAALTHCYPSLPAAPGSATDSNFVKFIQIFFFSFFLSCSCQTCQEKLRLGTGELSAIILPAGGSSSGAFHIPAVQERRALTERQVYPLCPCAPTYSTRPYSQEPAEKLESPTGRQERKIRQLRARVTVKYPKALNPTKSRFTGELCDALSQTHVKVFIMI